MNILQNPHIQTIVPSVFRLPPKIKYHRVTIPTPDNDFIDLDWSKINENKNSNKLAILIHGLEGASGGAYIKNSIAKLRALNYDAIAMNLRGCSGRPNLLVKSYHSGKSEDLATALDHIFNTEDYTEITLIGFSVGGNIILKYLGEQGDKLDTRIKNAVSFSAPIDLECCANALARPECKIYMKYFLDKLYKKVRLKEKMFPYLITSRDFLDIENFHEYDKCYTAPLNGFEDEIDYWHKASSKPWLTKITIPTLLLVAKDDPFLGPRCYPYDEAKINSNLHLIVTEHGGHVGFWELEFRNGLPRIQFYYEQYMIDFLKSDIPAFVKAN